MIFRKSEISALGLMVIFWSLVIMCYALDLFGVRELVDGAPGMSDRPVVAAPAGPGGVVLESFAMSEALKPIEECGPLPTSSVLSWVANTASDAMNMMPETLSQAQATLRPKFDDTGYKEYMSYIARKMGGTGVMRTLDTRLPEPQIVKAGEGEEGCVWYVKIPLKTDVLHPSPDVDDETWKQVVTVKVVGDVQGHLAITGWRGK